MEKSLKHYINKRRLMDASLIMAVVVVVLVAILIIKPNSTDAAPKKKDVPQFSFTGAAGWYQGPTGKTDILIFPNDRNCFVSVQHINGSAADKQAIGQTIEAQLATEGHTFTTIANQTMAIKTNSGAKQYQLAQISVTNPPGASNSNGSLLYGAQEYAYMQLSSKDFLYAEGYCETADELATTLPVLSAIQFDASK